MNNRGLISHGGRGGGGENQNSRAPVCFPVIMRTRSAGQTSVPPGESVPPKWHFSARLRSFSEANRLAAGG